MAIAFRSLTSLSYASRTNTVLTAPAGLADGDILVAVVVTALATTAPTPTAPSGFAAWGTATSVTDFGGFNGKLHIFWKRASSESGSYTFTHTSCSSEGVLKAYSGCLASGTPLGATSNNSGANVTSTGTGITTTAANSWLLYEAHDWEGLGGLTPPTGMTERYDGLIYSADQLIASAGATGNRTQTNNNGAGDPLNGRWAVRMVELLQASSGSTYNDATAETATAADTPAGLLTTTKAIAETATAAETATGLLVTAKAVAESASAADSVNGLVADADAVAWGSQVVTNGGTVSAGRLATVSDFITAEKAAGTWALTDDYWVLWAENEIQALTSLKQRRLATATATPTFTADRGYVFNGTSQFINTGFVPSTHQVAMTGSNMRMAAYERTNVTGATVTMGAATTALSNMHFIARTGTTTSSRLNSSSTLINYTLPAATSVGYTAVSRNGSTLASCAGYKNGAAMVQLVTAPTFDSVAVTFAMYLAAQNSGGTAVSFRAASIGFAAIGASLSAAEELAQYNNVRAMALTVGALQEGSVTEMVAANDTVAADVIPGEVTPEVPTQVPGAGPPGPDRRRFELYLLPEEDEEKPRRKRRLRLKKAELEEKVETAVEYIAAGSPQPMSQKAMAAQVSTLMGLDALLEIDRRRVERTIYRYLEALLAEEEEEEIVSFLLAA